MAITTEDEHFHNANDDPYWSESGWFAFTVPEREMGGWVYFFHRPNMNLSAGGVSLWDPTGEDVSNCLYNDWENIQALPKDADMFDFTLDNGLTVACETPLESYRMSYVGPGYELDLSWRAAMAPHTERIDNVALEGWSEVLDEVHPTGHYEQGGRMTGSLILEGERIEVDCWSIRDHSWGPRKLSKIPRADYMWGIASAESSFEAIGVGDPALTDDPFTGTDDAVVSGWYTRDGVIGDIVEGTNLVTRRGSDGRPMTTELIAFDHLGRELRAAGTIVSGLQWRGYSSLLTWNCTTRWEFDGQTAWGENDFYCTVPLARRFLRSGSR